MIFQLLFSVCDRNTPIHGRGTPYLLPTVTQVINLAEDQERETFFMLTRVKSEPVDVDMESRNEVYIVMNFSC